MIEYTEPCVNTRYFSDHKFGEGPDNIFTRKEVKTKPNPLTKQIDSIEYSEKFIVYYVDPQHGTNIEFYVDDKLVISGYWTDRTDFEKDFKL